VLPTELVGTAIPAHHDRPTPWVRRNRRAM